MAGTKSKFTGGSLNFYDKTHNAAFPTGVWGDCPILAIQADPSVGYIANGDFSNLESDVGTTVLDGYTVTQATAGQLAFGDTPGGALHIDANSTTDGQGLQIQYQGDIFKPAAGKDIWFEVSFQVDELANSDLFLGLAETDASIVATSAMTTNNHIGWHCFTGDGVMLLAAEKATAAATKTSDTLTEDTDVKLGFKVNGVTSIEHWIDGAKQSTSHVTANIPILALTPSFVCHSTGTQDPILKLNWWRCAQLR